MPAEPGRPDYDQALKALLVRAHAGVLALTAPDLTFVAERPTTIPAERREADLVWEVQHADGQRGLLHLELQTRIEADLGERLLEYFVRLRRHHGLPVRTVLVLLRESGRQPPLPLLLDWGGGTRLQFECHVVRLWEVPPAFVLERPEPALWPLAMVMAGATLATVADVAERLTRQVDMPIAERQELLGLAAGLAGLRLPREAVQQLLRRDPMLRDLLRDSSVAQGWYEEGRQEGRKAGLQEGQQAGREQGLQEGQQAGREQGLQEGQQAGREQGLQEGQQAGREQGLQEGQQAGREQGLQEGQQAGREQGLQEGQRVLVRQALEDRFGTLDDALLAAVAAADAATLRAVVGHLAIDTLAQVRQRLGLR